MVVTGQSAWRNVYLRQITCQWLKFPNNTLEVGVASELITQALGMFRTESSGAHTGLAV